MRRQIEKLESLLEVVLFTRATNGLVPTELALAMLPHAESIAANARALVRAASGSRDGDRGTVRLAASEVMGVEVLPAILARLAARQPRIQIELVLSNRNEDLIRRDADLAVRMVRPTQEGLVSRRIGQVELGLFASAEYLAQHRAPKDAGALTAGHALIGGDRDRGFIDALAQLGVSTTPRDFTLRSDSQVAQLAAVRAGLGIGVCQLPLARRAPALQRVVPALGFALEIYVVMHEDLRGAKRVRTVFDHLAGELTRYASEGAAKRASLSERRPSTSRSDSPTRGARRSSRGRAPPRRSG